MAYDDSSFYGDMLVDEYDEKNNLMNPVSPTGYLFYHLIGDGFDAMSDMCSKFLNDCSVLSCDASSLDKFWGVSYNMPRPVLYEGVHREYSLIDNGTISDHTDCWEASSSSTITRTETHTQTHSCLLINPYITSHSVVEFEFKIVNGNKNNSIIRIKSPSASTGSSTTYAGVSLNDLGAELEEWVHIKMIFNNTNVITIHSTNLSAPIQIYLHETFPNYKLNLYGGATNTDAEIYFKNVKIYTGEDKERLLTDDEYRIYLYLRNCRLLTVEDIIINFNKCFSLNEREISLTQETHYLETVDHTHYYAAENISSNIAKNNEDSSKHYITNQDSDDDTETLESLLSKVEETETIINIPPNSWSREFLEFLEPYISIKGNLRIKESLK